MEFKKYDNPKEFVEENEKLILEKEWLNNLMVGNYSEALEKGIDENWLLAKVTDGGKTELIMLLRKPWKLLLYSPTGNITNELYKFAAEEVYKVEKDLPGVNTEKEIGKIFAEEYCRIANKKYKVHTEMRILVLEKLIEGKLRDDVIYRKAKVEDKEVLKGFNKEFYKEALNEEIADEVIEEKVSNYLKRGYFLLEKDGKIVVQTVFGRDLKKGKCISGVYTPKEERGKGYAYNLVYRISKESLDTGAEYCVLFTDDSNPISNHVYEKIGYERKADIYDLDFV